MRVVEVIPGKSVMGLEIPNEKREIVTLGEIIKSKAYDEVASPLALALGKDIGGAPICADLAKMPHLLIAGTTGSGKSVAINAMVLSLLYKSTAEHVRLIMIDPKMLELSVYEGIPHLLAPVVTDMKHAANALALVRGGDGAALPAHVGAGSAQHRGLQPAREGRHRLRQADPRSGDDRGRRQRSDHRPEADPAISRRCRTSWSSSTSSPT